MSATPFQCPHAERGQDRCPAWRCDCFVDLHPDDPFGLHPEAFVVGRVPPSSEEPGSG
jgi:hypothetical protein